MTAISIHRLDALYHLPPSRQRERARLDRLLRLALERELEPALRRAGIDPHDEICIREVRNLVRLDLSQPDEVVGAAWAEAIAQGVARIVAGAREPELVRYSSRRAALVDLVSSVAAGDVQRAWAWRQLGLWRAPEGASAARRIAECVNALLSEPEALVGVFVALARAGRLEAFAVQLASSHWRALARAALAAAGSRGTAPQLGVPSLELSPQAEELIERVRRSEIARALGLRAALVDPDALGAIATLILLEVDPALLQLEAPPWSAVAEAVARMRTQARRESGSAERTADAPDLARAEERAMEVAGLAHSAWGGLLFLVWILLEHDLYAQLAQSDAGRRHGLRAVLHALAQVLLPVAQDDPAALAFAGLAPDAEPPPPLCEPDERAALEAIAQRIAQGLADRLELELELELKHESSAALVVRMSRRPAQVRAEPGWIEILLDLRDVDTELRRAGLDLNPGWVPWIGTVLQFSYA